jgi:flagella basal body P-ring formation protein FlgA
MEATMTLTFILRFAVAALIAMAIASIIASRPAAAAALLDDVVVETDVVTLGDLFDGAGSLADRPVFRSPDPGVDGALPAADALAAARAAGLEPLPTTIMSVRVIRRGLAYDERAIREWLSTEAASRLGVGYDDVDLRFDSPPAVVHVDASSEEPLTLESWTGGITSGRFRAVLLADVGASARRVVVGGSVVVTQPVAVLVDAVDRGAVIGESDVAIERRDRRQVSDGTVVDPSDLVGMAARRPLRPGDLVRSDQVEPPRVVRRGQLVTMVYKSPGIALTARGRALADAAVGEAVTVVNEQSRRSVEGVAVGPDEVEILAPSLRTTAALAAE